MTAAAAEPIKAHDEWLDELRKSALLSADNSSHDHDAEKYRYRNNVFSHIKDADPPEAFVQDRGSPNR
jgi:hypothetical protein